METLDKHFRNLAGAAFKKHGFASADVVSHWPEIAGAEIAKISFPQRIRWPRTAEATGGTLILVAAPGRSLDVQYASANLLERINQYLGFAAIAKIKVEASHATPPQKTTNPLPERPDFSISDQQLNDISDNALKQALARLGGAIKSGEKGSPQGS
jgi:hypothetical protein